MKKVIKINENELNHIIKRYIKEYIDPEGCLDDPNAGDPFGDFRSEIVDDYDGDEKAAENAYSWGLLHNGHMTDLESDRMANARRHEQEWTPRQLSSADKMKSRWVRGERSLDDLDDAFYGSSLDETVNRVLNRIKESIVNEAVYLSNAWYIMFDGTSYYPIYGADVEEDMAENDSKVVKGPFADLTHEIENKIEELNYEAEYGINWRQKINWRD